MRFLLITILAALIPTIAFANDHATPGAGYGTAVTVGSKKMEGTSGVLMHQTTNDVWIWEKPLKGFPGYKRNLRSILCFCIRSTTTNWWHLHLSVG